MLRVLLIPAYFSTEQEPAYASKALAHVVHIQASKALKLAHIVHVLYTALHQLYPSFRLVNGDNEIW